jgi:hypothetical protein
VLKASVRTAITIGFFLFAPATFCGVATAQVLDNLLPEGIPGYGVPFGVLIGNRNNHPDITGYQLGTLMLAPELTVAGGYDSAPNGAPASSLGNISPNLFISDPILGLGAYAAGDFTKYPQDSAQNMNNMTLAIGQRALLPEHIITLSAGYLQMHETAFALNTIDISAPLAFTVQDLRASDEISIGIFKLKPEVSVSLYHFPDFAEQDRTDTREHLTASYFPGSPVQILLRLQASQSNYREAIFNADTNQFYAGLVDSADGLWTVSALAGAAERLPRTGSALTAPVLETRLDWMPSRLDQVRLTLAREIDDPDEISATAYTLTEAAFSLTHQIPSEAKLKFTFQASNADYFESPLRETLFSSDADISWPLGRFFSVNGDYTFNDRQANYLRAANEHIITLGLVWTP